MIKLRIKLHKGSAQTNTHANDFQSASASKKQYILRWDHSNLSSYYQMTYELFVDFNRRLDSRAALLSNGENSLMINDEKVFIEVIFNLFIHNLNLAASSTIMTKKVNFYKY